MPWYFNPMKIGRYDTARRGAGGRTGHGCPRDSCAARGQHRCGVFAATLIIVDALPRNEVGKLPREMLLQALKR